MVTPLVGLAAQRWFGFSGAAHATGDPSVDTPKAHALGSAMLAFTAVPWSFCLLMNCGACCTGRGRERGVYMGCACACVRVRVSCVCGGGDGGGGWRGDSLHEPREWSLMHLQLKP